MPDPNHGRDAYSQGDAGGHGPEPSHPPPPEVIKLGHQPEAIRLGAILKFVAVLIIGGLITHLALWGLYAFYKDAPHPSDTERTPFEQPRVFMEPTPLQLQTDERRDLEQQRAAWEREMRSYAWTTDETGRPFVRLPIDLAKKLVAHGRMPPGANTATQPATPLP